MHVILRIPFSHSRLLWRGDDIPLIFFALNLMSVRLYLGVRLHDADSCGVMTTCLCSLCSNPDVIQAILRIPSSRSRLLWFDIDDDKLVVLLRGHDDVF